MDLDLPVLYLEATLQAFSSWLEQYTRQLSQAMPSTENGMIYLNPAEAEISRMYGEYSLIMHGIYQPPHQLLVNLPRALTFFIRPVGRSQTIVVRPVCQDLAFEPYFQEILASIRSTWPDATPAQLKTASQAPSGFLAQLRLKGSLDEFELELQHFTSRYQAANVEYASIQECSPSTAGTHSYSNRKYQNGAEKPEYSRTVKIHLLVDKQPFLSIRDIPIEIAATRLGGQYPLFLEVSFKNPLYRESFRFCEVFLTHCLGLWNSVPADFAYMAQALRAERKLQAGWIWPGSTQPATETVAVIEAYRPAAAPAQPEPAIPAPEAAPTAPATPAWEKITDHSWDRQALKLWWEGQTCPEIGKVISQSPKTVLNRLCTLRKVYGTDLIPIDKQRQKRDRRL